MYYYTGSIPKQRAGENPLPGENYYYRRENNNSFNICQECRKEF